MIYLRYFSLFNIIIIMTSTTMDGWIFLCCHFIFTAGFISLSARLLLAGVLKDYLRELPEPLFTNALYQMLLDALSVRLPSDPEGSAKLMLSILECLPTANQVMGLAVMRCAKQMRNFQSRYFQYGRSTCAPSCFRGKMLNFLILIKIDHL